MGWLFCCDSEREDTIWAIDQNLNFFRAHMDRKVIIGSFLWELHFLLHLDPLHDQIKIMGNCVFGPVMANWKWGKFIWEEIFEKPIFPRKNYRNFNSFSEVFAWNFQHVTSANQTRIILECLMNVQWELTPCLLSCHFHNNWRFDEFEHWRIMLESTVNVVDSN